MTNTTKYDSIYRQIIEYDHEDGETHINYDALVFYIIEFLERLEKLETKQNELISIIKRTKDFSTLERRLTWEFDTKND